MSDLLSEEIVQEIMGENSKETTRYVSCIRIDGSPILPPLIDEKYRNELTHYRNLAILVEKKIKDRKNLKDNRNSVDSGVIINGLSGEPSWLRPCMLQSKKKDVAFQQSFENKDKSSCGTHCIHRSNSSDDASPKNFICDDDMWRYVSSCADEQFSTAWFDNQAEDFLSNFGAGLTIDTTQSTLTPCNYSQMPPYIESENVRTTSILDKSERSLDIGNDAVTRLGVFYAEYYKDINEQSRNNINVGSSTGCIGSENCSNERSDANYILPSPVNTHPDFPKMSLNDKDMYIPGAVNYCEHNVLETSECEQYLAKLGSMSSQSNCSSSNTDTKNNSSGGTTVNSTQLLGNNNEKNHCNLLETSKNETTTIDQENGSVPCASICKDTYILSANHGEENSGIKISCSSVSLPEFPGSLSPELNKKQKPYNPMYYDSSDNTQEVSHQSIKMIDGAIADPQKKWLCDSVNNSEDSSDDPCNNTIKGNSLHIENSLSSQKTLGIPFSPSRSVSEIDFQSSSVSTLAPDISECASDLPNCLSVEGDSKLTPPKLVRQNSYTLITPSPILLAHAKASEKHGDKTSSEDDHSKCKVINHENPENDKSKGDGNLMTGLKYVYASPCKKNAIMIQNKTKQSSKKGERNRIKSLPGSKVSSPTKINLFHSSLDNLPIVTVRRFQELIDNKANQKEPCRISSKTNLNEPDNLYEKKTMTSRSYSMDLQELNDPLADNTLKCRSKSDLQDSTGNHSSVLNTVQEAKKNSKTEMNAPCSNFPLKQFPANPAEFVAMSGGSSPKSCQENKTNFDEMNATQMMMKIQDNEQKLDGSSLSPTDNTVHQIFLQLQYQHSQLMSQLLDRQKKEQEALANTFLNQQRQILQEMKLIPSSPTEVHTTSSATDTNFNNIEKKSPALHIDSKFGSVSAESHFSASVEMPDSYGNYEHSRYNPNSNTCNIMHHKSEGMDKETHKLRSCVTGKQIQAATVINAAVRGFLVRRLLKTDHVQEIINTISETVQCALQLQRECPVDITPSDVELHRRLIQQLTAACYSLHDTFFSLSTQEKMNIIANDREKQRNPALRPSSARSSLSTATQKYIQRKQQQNRQSERSSTNPRRSWWRSKTRACSAGEAPSWLPQQYPACMLACPRPYRYVLSSI